MPVHPRSLPPVDPFVSQLAVDPAPLPEYRLKRAEEPVRVAVLGAGPVGLEAALYAHRLGMHVRIFEAGAQAAADVYTWAHVPMFTPWADNRTSLGELALREAAHLQHKEMSWPRSGVYPTGGELIGHYLQPLADLLKDALHLETRVVAVGRSYLFPEEYRDDPEARQTRRFRLLTRSPREERIFTADFVFDATGVSHTPCWMGVGGLPALGEMGSRQRIFTQIPDILGRDRIHFLGKRTLLVGDGPSAATCATWLGELMEKDPPASLLWAVKSHTDLPLALVPHDPLARRDLVLKKANLLAAGGHSQLEFLRTTQVEAVQHSLDDNRFLVTLQVDHITRRLRVDSVIAAVGSRSDAQTFEKFLQPTELGFFTLGSKASTRSGKDAFLGAAHSQIRDTFRAILSDPEIDLYAQSAQALAAQERLSRE